MERHAQTIISLVITSILLWAGSSLSELREIVARQDERMVIIQRTVDGFGVVRNDLSTLRDSVTTNESTLKFLEAQFQQREWTFGGHVGVTVWRGCWLCVSSMAVKLSQAAHIMDGGLIFIGSKMVNGGLSLLRQGTLTGWRSRRCCFVAGLKRFCRRLLQEKFGFQDRLRLNGFVKFEPHLKHQVR